MRLGYSPGLMWKNGFQWPGNANTSNVIKIQAFQNIVVGNEFFFL